MTREAALGKLSRDDMLKLVEVQLKKAYEKACRQLVANGQISPEVCENALSLSNIDTMNNSSKKFRTFPYTLCALLFALFSVGMNVFYYEYQHLDIFNTVALILLSGYMGFYIGVKIRH